ncbi:MAG: hypothetical protein ACRDMJ_09920 [Solirubrobacteraceae bacterium]
MAVGSAIVTVAVVVLAIVLLHARTSTDHSAAGRPRPHAPIPRTSTRALIAELGILRQPQTAQARALNTSPMVTREPPDALGRQLIPDLTRLVSLPAGGKLFLYITPYGLGYHETYPGGGSGVCCITSAELRKPIGPASGFASGPGIRRTYHQMYFEIVPDGVARVHWEFPRRPTYPDAPPGLPFAKPLSVSVPVRDNVAALWMAQRGRAMLDTWYAADGRVLAAKRIHQSRDPASNVLISQRLFLPADTGATTAEAARLNRIITAATRAGYSIRVAIVASKSDLGPVRHLWRSPQIYARFLGRELTLTKHSTLLVASPNGFGLYQPGRTPGQDQAQLTQAPTPRATASLTTRAAEEVQNLAAAAGHSIG